MDLVDGKCSTSESTKLDEEMRKTSKMEKGQASSRLISKDLKNTFSSTTIAMTQLKKKMFSIKLLETTSKVIGTHSWLKDTLERKRERKDEGVSTKDTVSLVVHSKTALTKLKK